MSHTIVLGKIFGVSKNVYRIKFGNGYYRRVYAAEYYPSLCKELVLLKVKIISR